MALKWSFKAKASTPVTADSSWRPRRFLRPPELGENWHGFNRLTSSRGQPGITHVCGNKTERLEWRDSDGRLRGLLVIASGRVILMTEPGFQRRGVGSALLDEAHEIGMEIDFTTQQYTKAGWAAVSRHLQRIGLKLTDEPRGQEDGAEERGRRQLATADDL